MNKLFFVLIVLGNTNVHGGVGVTMKELRTFDDWKKCAATAQALNPPYPPLDAKGSVLLLSGYLCVPTHTAAEGNR